MSNTPFLCHFLDKVTDKPKKRYLVDFKRFSSKLGLAPDSTKRVLILSNTLDRETDVVCVELLRRGMDYIRINVEEVFQIKVTNIIRQDRKADCEIKINSTVTKLTDISAIWVRDFDYHLIHSNNSSLNAAFIFQQWNDALQIMYNTVESRWINSIDAIRRASNRIKQLALARQAGFNIPSTLITNDPDHARNFYGEMGNVILKALHHHNIELENKVYSLYSRKLTDNDLSMLDDLVYAPCVLQEEIVKQSELRVTVVKDKVFSAELESKSDDLHRIPLNKLRKKPINLGDHFDKQCVMLIKSFGLDYGAIDFIKSDDKLYFLELNPTGSWLWIEQDTKQPITHTVVDLILDK